MMNGFYKEREEKIYSRNLYMKIYHFASTYFVEQLTDHQNKQIKNWMRIGREYLR